MMSRGLVDRSLLFLKSPRDVKRIRGRIRGVLLIGTAVLILWSSPTSAKPSLPTIPQIASSQSAISNVTLLLENDNANGAVFGGLATNAGGFGVVGLASATSSANFGVAGATQSSTGTGVYGLALSSTCPVTLPLDRGQTCVGVIGQSVATSGTTAGVMGTVASSGGAGVYGVAFTSIGVLGRNEAASLPFDTFNIGVAGQSNDGVGVDGSAFTGTAVRGRALHFTGTLFSGLDPIGNETFGVDSTGRVRIANANGTSCVVMLSCTNELFFKDNGQIRSGDDNHRIIFDRTNNNLEVREYGNLIFSPGATSGARTQAVTFTSGGDIHLGSVPNPASGGTHSLYIENNGGDPNNSFRIDGVGNYGASSDALVIAASSGVGASHTPWIVFRAGSDVPVSDQMEIVPGAVSVAGNLTVGRNLSVIGTQTAMEGDLVVAGSLTVYGTKSSVAKLADGRAVALYAVESPENWFEDFGGAQLHNGVAWVLLEPTFAQTVNPKIGYRVFLTPNGDCAGLYVAKKTATGFEVRELGGRRSDVKFDYRIVAKRRGFETVRLAEVPATSAARPGQSPAK